MFWATKYFRRNLYCLINLTRRLFAMKFTGVCYDTSHTSVQLTSDCGENVGKDTYWVHFSWIIVMRRCLRQVVQFMSLHTFIFGFVSLCAGKSSKEKRRIHMDPVYNRYVTCLVYCIRTYTCCVFVYHTQERKGERKKKIHGSCMQQTSHSLMNYLRIVNKICSTCNTCSSIYNIKV